MRATITKIDTLKRGNGAIFQRVYFKTESGQFAVTDLCPTFRNFTRWRPLLQIGTEVDNLLVVRTESLPPNVRNASKLIHIDADSRVVGVPQPKRAKQFVFPFFKK
jgi:hypothetical protein